MRDMFGRSLGKPHTSYPPYIPPDRDDGFALLKNLPFPAYCCWNGVAVINPEPFYLGLRFRRAMNGECSQCECSLMCNDFWSNNYTFVVVDPSVKVAYNYDAFADIIAHHGVDFGPSWRGGEDAANTPSSCRACLRPLRGSPWLLTTRAPHSVDCYPMAEGHLYQPCWACLRDDLPEVFQRFAKVLTPRSSRVPVFLPVSLPASRRISVTE